MDRLIASRVHEAVAAVCPIDGVGIGDPADKTTWRITFLEIATEDQREAARAVIEAFAG